jgi:hypothetical protein
VRQGRRGGGLAIAVFICPTPQTRAAFGARFVVWIDRVESGRLEDTNRLFALFGFPPFCVIRGWRPNVDSRGYVSGKNRAASDFLLFRATTALAVRTARPSSPVSSKILFATSLHIRRSASVSASRVWRGTSSGSHGNLRSLFSSPDHDTKL